MNTEHSSKDTKAINAAARLIIEPNATANAQQGIEPLSEFDCIQRLTCIDLDAPWCVCDRADRI